MEGTGRTGAATLSRAGDITVLDNIQQRVLWLATNMIDYANNRRKNLDGIKVGGHQASSASVVSILTALYFSHLRPGDRIAVKPHAAPAFHAIQYLLGNLDQSYLTRLRSFHGLQSYPSRLKDPDRVDFSTGSMGLGTVAPSYAALAHQYASDHFGRLPAQRFIALLGDAELDEGSVWESVLDESLNGMGNVLWIVDLNRQSLDRVIPGIRARQLMAFFRDMGWNVLEAKYGRKLKAAFERPGGDALRQCIDDMSNEEYQFRLRQTGAEIRAALTSPDRPRHHAIAACLSSVPDDALPALLADLAGHDLAELLDAFDLADAHTDSPTVLFAYTIKGWGLPIAGAPDNHARALSQRQMVELREQLGIAPEAEWDGFSPDSPEGQACRAAAERLRSPATGPAGVPDPATIPIRINTSFGTTSSSQEAFGRILAELARTQPEIADRVVTASPDVAVTTHLAAWTAARGQYAHQAKTSDIASASLSAPGNLGPTGHHIELGIAENNLMMLLGQFGLSAELVGQHLVPIGTVYDPFVCRGLDALMYSLSCGSKFILIGTPSGVTLSPEGGAHQSIVTPTLAIGLPNLISYEPCFAKEVEWTLLEGIRQCADRANGVATYLRLSTKPIDQRLIEPALNRLGEDELSRQVLAGGYRLIDWRQEAPDLTADAVVQIAATGVMIPEAVAAARRLHAEGIAANVLHITSPVLLYRGLYHSRRRQLQPGTASDALGQLSRLIPADERSAPIVTVEDGCSHTLSFLGSVFGAPLIPLGVEEFGQSGALADIYAHLGIDEESIYQAGLLALEVR
jgi:pyruvate dehydrogenase E1 component